MRKERASSWLLWQLADSAFPTGGFAHSGGLEAAFQHGEVRDAFELERFVEAVVWQTGHAQLPLVNAAYEEPARLSELDALCDVFLSNHVANRASRVLGRTFVGTCERALGVKPPLERGHWKQHYAPAFGAVARELGLERDEMQRLLLHLTVRSTLSAAIRLGVLGPYEAQRLQRRLAPTLDAVLRDCAALGADDLAQTAPLVEVFQGTQDRLYSRLFQS